MNDKDVHVEGVHAGLAGRVGVRFGPVIDKTLFENKTAPGADDFTARRVEFGLTAAFTPRGFLPFERGYCCCFYL